MLVAMLLSPALPQATVQMVSSRVPSKHKNISLYGIYHVVEAILPIQDVGVMRV